MTELVITDWDWHSFLTRFLKQHAFLCNPSFQV